VGRRGLPPRRPGRHRLAGDDLTATHRGEVALDLAVDVALKANEQLLVEHRSDLPQRLEVGRVRPALETRDRRVGCASSGRDFLLGEPQLEASLAQVRGDGIGLAQLADPRVLVMRRPVLLAARSAIGCGVCRISSDRAVAVSRHSGALAYQFW